MANIASQLLDDSSNHAKEIAYIINGAKGAIYNVCVNKVYDSMSYFANKTVPCFLIRLPLLQ